MVLNKIFIQRFRFDVTTKAQMFLQIIHQLKENFEQTLYFIHSLQISAKFNLQCFCSQRFLRHLQKRKTTTISIQKLKGALLESCSFP